MARRICLYGFYSLPSALWQVQIPHVIEDLKGSNFTGLSLHLNSPWGQIVGHPHFSQFWNGTKFNLTKKNPVWYDCLEQFLHAMFAANLDVQFSFFDQYAESKDTPLGGVHPLTTNTFGKILIAKALYDSWIAQIEWKLAWIHWDDNPLGNFTPVAPFGNPMMLFVTSVMDVVKKVWLAHPTSKSRFIWKRANETRAYMKWDSTNKKWHADALKSLGDRMEIFRWMQLEWKKRGLIESPRFRSSNDYGAWIGEKIMPAGWTVDKAYASAMQESLKGTLNTMRASHMEIHGVGKTLDYFGGVARKTAAWYRDTAKLPLAELELSTDGLQMADGFDQYTKDLYNSGAPCIDLKMEEKSVPFVWSNTDMNRNWNRAFDSHAKRIA